MDDAGVPGCLTLPAAHPTVAALTGALQTPGIGHHPSRRNRMRPTRLAMRAAIWISAAFFLHRHRRPRGGDASQRPRRHHLPRRFPEAHRLVAGHSRHWLRRQYRRRRARPGHLPARKQRHALSHLLQPLRAYPRPGPILPGRGIQSAGTLGARIPGRSMRPRPGADQPLRRCAQHGGQRARPARLRSRRARVYRRGPGRYRRS